MHYPSHTGSADLERRAYNLHHLQLSMMAAQRQGQAAYRDGERQDAPLTPPSSAPLPSEDEFTQDGWTVIAPAPGARVDAYEREHQRQQIAQRALGLRPLHPGAPNASANGPGTPAGRLSRQRSSIPHWEQWDTPSASANAMANWAQRLRSLQQYNSAVNAARTSIPPAPVTPADIRIHSSRSFTPPNQIDRTDRSQQENHTPAATHPSFRTKAVYELDCNYCGQHICKRGMKAILLADTTIELFSTDCIPSG
ncbi:Protein fam72a [Gaertneriomyces sp. JEL0708]|nr:Protein fam72a [Gaertneriomyces sp. JEL0708]